MDCEEMRTRLGELRTQAEEMLKQLEATEAGSGADAWGLLEQFASAVDGMITRTGESDILASLERFFEILPPDNVKDEFKWAKKFLEDRLRPRKSLSEITKLYKLFIRFVEEPDFEWSDEEYDAVEDFFDKPLARSLLKRKYSIAPSVSAKDGGGIPLAPTEGGNCIPSAESESVVEEESDAGVKISAALDNENSERQESSSSEPVEPEVQEESSSDTEVSTALDKETSEQQDDSSPEVIEPEVPDLQEVLPHFEILPQKTKSSFSVKTFANDYCRKPNRRGELSLICWFVNMGALTKSQLEEYLFDENISNAQVEKLCKDGYASVVKHKESGAEFYALSAKGAEIFKKEMSREIMKSLMPILMKRPILLPSPPLNYESELAQIDADIDAYQCTATVALRLDDNEIVKCVERVHADPKIPITLLRLRDKGIKRDLVVTGVSKKVLLLPLSPDDHQNTRAEQEKSLRRLVQSECSDSDGCKRHYCTVSDDHATVSCFDPDGNSVELDKYIESLVQPASEDESENLTLGEVDTIELMDFVEWLTPENGIFLELKEFVKRIKEFTPKEDKSVGFKKLVKSLKRLSIRDPRILIFKKFIEGLKQRLIEGGDKCNVGLKEFIESLKQRHTSAEETGDGDTDDAADDLKQSDGTNHGNAADAANSNSIYMARQILDKKDITPSADKESFNALVSSLLDAAADATPGEKKNTDYIGRAVVLRKSLALADAEIYDADYQRLLLATDMPLDDRSYSMEKLSAYFSGENEGTAFHLAALLRALFLPASQYEYSLTDYARELFKRYDRVFGAYLELKSTLGVFIEITKVSGDGFTDKIVSRFIDEDSKNQFIKGLSSDAAELRQVPHINQRFNGVLEMLEICFGQESELGLCMRYISENKKSNREFVSKTHESFVDGGKASPQKINEFIDESWKEVHHNSKKWIRNDDIISTARQKINYAIGQRLEIINRWLAYADTSSDRRDDALNAMYSKTKKNLESTEEFLREDTSLPKPARAVLFRAIKNLSLRLSGKRPISFLPEDWLSTFLFAVADGRPVINEEHGDIRYYEPWRNAVRHIAEEPARGLRDVLTKIEDVEDPLYDNLGQAIAICEYLGIDKTIYQNSVKNARENAEKHLILEFEERLGLDLAYGRIGDQSKDAVVEDLERMKSEFFERNDFAGLRRFLTVLRDRLNDEIAEKRKYWESAILERRNNSSPDKFEFLDRAAKQLERGENALVEESLNLFDVKADPSQSDIDFDEEDIFSEFINDKKYNALENLFNKSKSIPLRNIAEKFVKERVMTSGGDKESARKLLQNLPNSPEKTGGEDIKIMLTELGFAVSTVKRDNPNQSPAVFTAKVTLDRKNAEESYKHPIAEMGTNIGDTLRVIELFGEMEPRDIIDAVQSVGLSRMSVVFLNDYITLAQRRQLARLFLKDGNPQTPFVLVDWILLFHLAQKYQGGRLRAMLACAMPYTGCQQLFSENSEESIADEMYVGRTEEIRQIIDKKNDPIFVYGGPQIGKTAALSRAKNIFHAPKDNNYGVYANVENYHDEESFVTALTDKMREADIGIASGKTTIKDMCYEIREWLSKSNNRRLLLLIDKSDNILSAFAENRYAALNDFAHLSQEIKRFKIVFAGLHNVFQAVKDANTVFEHFGKSICIRPLSQSDAYKLLARPLRYLGFNTNADTLLPLLANTNFYPGAVHFVGAELSKMLIRNYSEHYKESHHPPYRLDDRQIGSLMRSTGLFDKIEERIRLTLEVDIKYIMLARCIAALYYDDTQNRSLGYDVADIMKYAKELFEIDVLRNETKEQYESLLFEMCDMNVLVNMAGRYRFRQIRFLKIIGKDIDDILDQIARAKEGS